MALSCQESSQTLFHARPMFNLVEIRGYSFLQTCLKISKHNQMKHRRKIKGRRWLGEKDSNPHSQSQNLMSYP